jgi:hypothetical protein
MTIRHPLVQIAVVAGCLSLLGAFISSSLRRELDAEQGVTFQMKGDVISLEVGFSGTSSSPQYATYAKRLHILLEEHAISVVIAPLGDGAPRMLVFDPSRRVPWYSDPDSGAELGVRILSGTYSSDQWAASGKTPLLPADATVIGLLDPPPGSEDAQYVEPLGNSFSPGRYAIGGAEPEDLSKIQALLLRQGLVVQSAREENLSQHMVRDGGVQSMAVMLALGCLTGGAYWVLLLGERKEELKLRRRHGATLFAVAFRWLIRGLPQICVGVVAGAGASAFALRVVGGESLQLWRHIADSTSLGLTVALATWSVAVAIGVGIGGRSRDLV